MINIFKRNQQPAKTQPKQEAEIENQKPLVETPKKTKTSRIQDRDLFKSLLAGLYDGILIIDSHGCLIQTNQRARDFFGYSEAELWNINCSELIPQLNAQIIFKIRSHINKNRHTVVNAICVRQDATKFPAEIAISNICMMNDDDLVLSIRNCEKRIKAQHAHQVRNNAIENAGAGIISCTTDGTIQYANPAFLKMVMAENMQEVSRHKIGDFCPNPTQLKQLLESPSHNASWYGKMDLITMRDTPLQVQTTSVMTETYVDKEVKQTLVITMTLLADTSVRATIK